MALVVQCRLHALRQAAGTDREALTKARQEADQTIDERQTLDRVLHPGGLRAQGAKDRKPPALVSRVQAPIMESAPRGRTRRLANPLQPPVCKAGRLTVHACSRTWKRTCPKARTPPLGATSPPALEAPSPRREPDRSAGPHAGGTALVPT